MNQETSLKLKLTPADIFPGFVASFQYCRVVNQPRTSVLQEDMPVPRPTYSKTAILSEWEGKDGTVVNNHKVVLRATGNTI